MLMGRGRLCPVHQVLSPHPETNTNRRMQRPAQKQTRTQAEPQLKWPTGGNNHQTVERGEDHSRDGQTSPALPLQLKPRAPHPFPPQAVTTYRWSQALLLNFGFKKKMREVGNLLGCPPLAGGGRGEAGRVVA